MVFTNRFFILTQNSRPVAFYTLSNVGIFRLASNMDERYYDSQLNYLIYNKYISPEGNWRQ